MGTDKDAMYLHYVVFGANEGRRAYGENTVAPVIDAQGMTLPYSPETEDVIPEPIVFEPDGGVIFNCNSL